MSEVTRIMSAIEQGDPHAAEQLLPLVYDELRKLAAQKLAQERYWMIRHRSGNCCSQGPSLTKQAHQKSTGGSKAAGQCLSVEFSWSRS